MYTYNIVVDESPYNPRTEYDWMGKMVCWHRRYTLGDEQPNESPQDYITRVFGSEKEFEKKAISLPLYLYDHSGLTISTTPFSCPWDSGQVGFIYIPKEVVLEELSVKRISKAMRQQVEDLLRAEVREYNYYLSGEVYGVEIVDEDGEVVDSYWGLFGYDEAVRFAQEELESYSKGG